MQDPEVSTFRDRTLRLRVCGAILVLGALLVGGVSALFAVVLFSSPESAGVATPGERSILLLSLGLYGLVAVLLLILGVGSWLARRWARAIVLAAAWFGLVVGTFSMIVVAAVLPQLSSALASEALLDGTSRGAEMAEGMLSFVLFLTLTICFVLYVVLPGCYVLAFRGRDVRATCEARDPRPSWTDELPLPVMALVVGLAFASLSFLVLPFYPSMPFFGMILRGSPLLIVSLAGGLLLAVLAVSVSRRSRFAWWGTLGLVILGAVSTLLTFTRLGIAEIYQDWELPEPQVELVREMLASPWLPVVTGLGFVAALVFLSWLRRYFGSDPGA